MLLFLPDTTKTCDLGVIAKTSHYTGALSTSASICAMFFYLSRNPKCYQRLANEIRSTFSMTSDIRGGRRLSSCGYLRACIDEALRIATPVPRSFSREASSKLGSMTARICYLVLGLTLVKIYSLIESHSTETNIAVELIEVKLFWVVESDNCLTRSKLYGGELRSSIYIGKYPPPVGFPAPLIT